MHHRAVRRARVARGMTQGELGALLEVEQSTISRLERGLGSDLSMGLVARMAKVLGVSPASFGDGNHRLLAGRLSLHVLVFGYWHRLDELLEQVARETDRWRPDVDRLRLVVTLGNPLVVEATRGPEGGFQVTTLPGSHVEADIAAVEGARGQGAVLVGPDAGEWRYATETGWIEVRIAPTPGDTAEEATEANVWLVRTLGEIILDLGIRCVRDRGARSDTCDVVQKMEGRLRALERRLDVKSADGGQENTA